MRSHLVGGIVVLMSGFAITSSSAEVPCFPGQDSRIAICSSSCSAVYCGYNLPLAGKRHVGAFLTYYTTGDNAPLDVAEGKDEAVHYMRVVVPNDDVSLHMSIDEIPDFCCYVRVEQENGPFFREFRFDANENFTLDDLKQSAYIIKIVHRLQDQGGRRARYVPMVYLAPTVKQDTAGGSYQTARNMGELSKDRKIEIDEYLQVVKQRKPDGTLTGSDVVNDQADWFRITTRTAGSIKVTFRPVAILDSAQVETSVGYATEFSQGPVAIPEQGYFVEPGTHYVVVQARPGFTDVEFGFKYHLQVTFVPKQ